MRRGSVFVLVGLGVLLLVGLFLKRGAFEPSPSHPAKNAEPKTEVERDQTPVPVDAKARRAWVAQRVKHIVAVQLGIETVSEKSQYSDIGADDLDC